MSCVNVVSTGLHIIATLSHPYNWDSIKSSQYYTYYIITLSFIHSSKSSSENVSGAALLILRLTNICRCGCCCPAFTNSQESQGRDIIPIKLLPHLVSTTSSFYLFFVSAFFEKEKKISLNVQLCGMMMAAKKKSILCFMYEKEPQDNHRQFLVVPSLI